MLKKISVFGMLLWMAILSVHAFAGTPIKVFVNNTQLSCDPAPYIVSGRVMLPIRAILTPLGAQFIWESKTQTVTIYNGSKKVKLVINRKEATVNGVKYGLDAPAVIHSGRTFVPMRFIAEAFDALVDWNGREKVVRVVTDVSQVNPMKAVTGYYYDYRSLESLQNNIDVISDTIHFTYELNSNGQIEEKPFFNQGFDLARANGMGIEMLVFANDRDQLKNLLNNTAMQQKVIEEIYSFLQSRSFDGVNIDFEYIDQTQSNQYVAFIRALREKMGSRYTLSLSVPARSSEREWWYNGYDYTALANIADRILVMAYDQHYLGGSPGPVAGCDWVESVINYMLPLIPKEKFQLGLGIYGYDWPSGGKGKSIYVQGARDLASSKGIKIQKDEVSGVSWFSYQDDQGVSHQVWYEDTSSVQTKLELVKKYKLAGIALWRLGIIPQDIWDVIRAFRSW